MKIKFLKLFAKKEVAHSPEGIITYSKYCSYINIDYPISYKEYTNDLYINLWFVILSFSWITKRKESSNVR